MLKEELKKIENEEAEVEHDPSIKRKCKEDFDSNGCQLEEKILSLQVKMAYLEKQMKMKDAYLEKEIELKFKYLKKEIELLSETKEKVTTTDVPAAVRELRFLDHHFSANQIHDEHSPTANVSSSGMENSSPTKLSSPPAAIDFQAAELLRQQDSMVKIGPNTKITLAQYNALDWTKGTQAVRDLCQAVFGREILRTHNLTGRFRGVSSNVQETKPPKPMLDPAKVADIIELASQMTNLSPSEVRRAITNKCKGTPNRFELGRAGTADTCPNVKDVKWILWTEITFLDITSVLPMPAYLHKFCRGKNHQIKGYEVSHLAKSCIRRNSRDDMK